MKNLLTIEWWNGLLQYGSLRRYDDDGSDYLKYYTDYLEEFTWQDIFWVHLFFAKKGIALNETTIELSTPYFRDEQRMGLPEDYKIQEGKLYPKGNCFNLYNDEFGLYQTPPQTIEEKDLELLAQIDSIWLYLVGVDSLEPLSVFKNLQNLNCADNFITDLSPLSNKKLVSLDCSYNKISSLEPLKNSHSLQKLVFANNQIMDLEDFKTIPNLYDGI